MPGYLTNADSRPSRPQGMFPNINHWRPTRTLSNGTDVTNPPAAVGGVTFDISTWHAAQRRPITQRIGLCGRTNKKLSLLPRAWGSFVAGGWTLMFGLLGSRQGFSVTPRAPLGPLSSSRRLGWAGDRRLHPAASPGLDEGQLIITTPSHPVPVACRRTMVTVSGHSIPGLIRTKGGRNVGEPHGVCNPLRSTSRLLAGSCLQ